MRTTRATAWVVYQAAVKGTDQGPRAVCDQAEWDAMEAATPGVNRLIRGGITNEAEAEKLRAKLGNEDFIARAPEEVVEENRERLAEAEERREKLTAALTRLG